MKPELHSKIAVIAGDNKALHKLNQFVHGDVRFCSPAEMNGSNKASQLLEGSEVIIADFMGLSHEQQTRIVEPYSLQSLNGSEIILLYSKDQADEVLPELIEKATTVVERNKKPEQLVELIENALANFQRKSELRENYQTVSLGISLLEQGTFVLRKPEEAKAIASLLASLAPNKDDVALGLTELLINAIEHGNLGISYSEKGELLKNGVWHQEIENRLQHKNFKNKRVILEFASKDQTLEFKITDEGKGFDFNKYLEPKFKSDNESHDYFHGRGIKLAKQLCFDNLQFQGCGNIVVASLELGTSE
ncbi:ATP-binding protein [Sneathiella limimaris]|uniref:ATP-binding protein n=1 Tax=Sneathiella limimaris TaxID=1964213 RepID=UPI00146C4AE4|nr:ATP-binding protein [Sneathiella limimaris]